MFKWNCLEPCQSYNQSLSFGHKMLPAAPRPTQTPAHSHPHTQKSNYNSRKYEIKFHSFIQTAIHPANCPANQPSDHPSWQPLGGTKWTGATKQIRKYKTKKWNNENNIIFLSPNKWLLGGMRGEELGGGWGEYNCWNSKWSELHFQWPLEERQRLV